MSAKKHPKIVKAEMGQIMQLLLENNTDKDIIRVTGLSRATYFRYKSRLFKESANQFAKKDIVDIAFHIDILHDKLTSYLKIIEDEIKKDSTTVEDKIELINTAREIAEDRYDLNVQSLELLVQRGGIRIVEQHRIQDQVKETKELL